MVTKLENVNEKEERKDIEAKLPDDKPKEEGANKKQEAGSVVELTSSNIESLFSVPGLLFVVKKLILKILFLSK